MTIAGRALLGAFLIAWWAGATPAAFAAAPQLTVAPLAGPPGATVSVSGAGFCAAPCSTVDLSFGGATVRDGVQVNASGHFHTTFTVPAGALGGVNNIFAEQRDTSGSDRQASAAFRVTPSTPVVGSSLPRTSSPPRHTNSPTTSASSSPPRHSTSASSSPNTTTTARTPPPSQPLEGSSASPVVANGGDTGLSAWWWLPIGLAVVGAAAGVGVWRRRAART